MTLRFIYRTGCSLCDAMWAELQEFRSGLEGLPRSTLGSVECVDLAGQPDLEMQYGDRIPLIEGDGEEICRYFFDAEAVVEYLSSPRIPV